MSHETEQKLFSFLEQEFGAIALQSDISEIEYIVCTDDVMLLNRAQTELRACYERLGYTNSDLLMSIDARLEQFPPTVPLGKLGPAETDSLLSPWLK